MMKIIFSIRMFMYFLVITLMLGGGVAVRFAKVYYRNFKTSVASFASQQKARFRIFWFDNSYRGLSAI